MIQTQSVWTLSDIHQVSEQFEHYQIDIKYPLYKAKGKQKAAFEHHNISQFGNAMAKDWCKGSVIKLYKRAKVVVMKDRDAPKLKNVQL